MPVVDCFACANIGTGCAQAGPTRLRNLALYNVVQHGTLHSSIRLLLLVQTVFTSMMVMVGCIEEKITAQQPSGLAAPYDDRLKQIVGTVVKSCTDLWHVLVNPAQEYGVLSQFLVRAIGGSELKKLLTDTATEVHQACAAS